MPVLVRSSLAASCVIVFMPLLAAGQVVWPPAGLNPSSPTSADVIQATFSLPSCTPVSTTTVDGFVVRTTVVLESCVFTDPFQNIEVQTFGPLPPGNYTYEIYYVYYPGAEPPVLRSTQAVSVTQAAAVAVTTPFGTALLIVSLVAAGLLVSARQ
jgi:hypothetical protein